MQLLYYRVSVKPTDAWATLSFQSLGSQVSGVGLVKHIHVLSSQAYGENGSSS